MLEIVNLGNRFLEMSFVFFDFYEHRVDELLLIWLSWKVVCNLFVKGNCTQFVNLNIWRLSPVSVRILCFASSADGIGNEHDGGLLILVLGAVGAMVIDDPWVWLIVWLNYLRACKRLWTLGPDQRGLLIVYFGDLGLLRLGNQFELWCSGLFLVAMWLQEARLIFRISRSGQDLAESLRLIDLLLLLLCACCWAWPWLRSSWNSSWCDTGAMSWGLAARRGATLFYQSNLLRLSCWMDLLHLHVKTRDLSFNASDLSR